LNSIVCLNRDSPSTKGLYFTISLIVTGKVSRGRTVLEKNNRTVATDIEAMFAVSDDLNTYPINIPIKMKTEDIRINATRVFNNSI